MGQVVRLIIGGQESDVQVKEYQGQRVVTFRQVDELHKRAEGTAARNFSTNRPKFIEGTDFFKLSPEEMRSTNFVERANPQGMVLLKESGYLMLVKSLTDDRAWEVQRQLVNAYFQAKALSANPSGYGPMINVGGYMVPSTMSGALRLAADQQDQIEAQQETIRRMAPKEEFHDQVTAAVNCVEITEFAKTLGAGPLKFFKWLRGEKILRADNLPRQEHVDAGRLKVEERTRTDREGNRHTYTVSVITGQGQSYLQKRWAQAGNVVQMQLQANG